MIYKSQKCSENDVIKMKSQDQGKMKSKQQGKFMRIVSKSKLPKQIIDFVFGQDQVQISENQLGNQIYLNFPLGSLNDPLPLKPEQSNLDFSSKQSKASSNNCMTKQQDSFQNFPFFKVNKSSKKNHQNQNCLETQIGAAFLQQHGSQRQLHNCLEASLIEQGNEEYKKLKDWDWNNTIKFKSQPFRAKKGCFTNEQLTTAQSLNSNTIFSQEERKQNGKNETKKISEFMLCDQKHQFLDYDYPTLQTSQENKQCNKKNNKRPNGLSRMNPTLSFEKMGNSLQVLQKSVQELQNTIKSIYNSTDQTEGSDLFVKDSLQEKISSNQRKHQFTKQKLAPEVQNQQIQVSVTNQENSDEEKVFKECNEQDYSKKNIEHNQSKKKLLDSLQIIQMKMFDSLEIHQINDSTERTEDNYRNFQDGTQRSDLNQDALKEQRYAINDKLPFQFVNDQRIDYSKAEVNLNMNQRNQENVVEVATETDTQLMQSTNQQDLEHNQKKNINLNQHPKQSQLIGKRGSLEMTSGVVLVHFENLHKQCQDNNPSAINASSSVASQSYPEVAGQFLNYEMYRTFKQKNLTKKRMNLHLDKCSGKVIELPYMQNPYNAVVVDGKTFPKFIKSKVYYLKG